MCSNLGGTSANLDHKTRLNIYRDWKKNSKTVLNMVERADTIMYFKKYNTVMFFSHEGEIGEVKNKDNMNIRQLAKNYKKRYEEV